MSWLKGKHSMNFGAAMRRYQDNYYSNDDMRGTLDFTSFQNFLLGLSGAPTAQGGNGTGHSDNNSGITDSASARAPYHRLLQQRLPLPANRAGVELQLAANYAHRAPRQRHAARQLHVFQEPRHRLRHHRWHRLHHLQRRPDQPAPGLRPLRLRPHAPRHAALHARPHAPLEYRSPRLRVPPFSGYEFAGTAVIQSGTAFEIDNSGGAAYYGTDTSRANYVVGATTVQAVKHGRAENRLTAYFNDGIYSTASGTVTQNDTLTSAPPVFATATNFYGNTGRNILRGPVQRDH